jgi:hypothetical protein
MTLRGTINGGAVVLDQPAPWPEGTRVEVLVKAVEGGGQDQARGKSTLTRRLLKHAGTVPGLPADMAAQHDHYIHGSAKR